MILKSVSRVNKTINPHNLISLTRGKMITESLRVKTGELEDNTQKHPSDLLQGSTPVEYAAREEKMGAKSEAFFKEIKKPDVSDEVTGNILSTRPAATV